MPVPTLHPACMLEYASWYDCESWATKRFIKKMLTMKRKTHTGTATIVEVATRFWYLSCGYILADSEGFQFWTPAYKLPLKYPGFHMKDVQKHSFSYGEPRASTKLYLLNILLKPPCSKSTKAIHFQTMIFVAKKRCIPSLIRIT